MYGFSVSQDKISTITDSILSDVNEWLNRPLKPLYTFMFVDCIYVKIKNEKGTVENNAVYVLLGIDTEGLKEVLGLYISPTESKSTWMNIFDNIKHSASLFACLVCVLALGKDHLIVFEQPYNILYPIRHL